MIIQAHNEQTETFAKELMKIAEKRYQHEQLNTSALTRDIAEKCGVSVSEAHGWKIGYSLPNDIQFGNLLNLLLGEGWTDDQLLSAEQKKLDGLLKNARNSVSDATLKPLSDEALMSTLAMHTTPEHKVTKPTHAGKGIHNGHRHSLTYYDSEGMPPREITKPSYGNARYENLAPDEWRSIQDKTKNFPEFLYVSRLLLQPDEPLTRTAFCKRVPAISASALKAFEVGNTSSKTTLPPQEKTRLLAKALFPNDQRMQDYAIALANRNCAGIASHYAEQGNYTGLSAREKRMEPDYFIEKLERCHEANGHTRRVKAPSWVDDKTAIPPVDRSYLYLGAVRNAFRLSTQEAAELSGFAERTIGYLESATQDGDKIEIMRDTLFKAYENYDQEGLLNREAYSQLSHEPMQSHVNRATAHASANEGRAA